MAWTLASSRYTHCGSIRPPSRPTHERFVRAKSRRLALFVQNPQWVSTATRRSSAILRHRYGLKPVSPKESQNRTSRGLYAGIGQGTRDLALDVSTRGIV